MKTITAWAILKGSNNILDGYHLFLDGNPNCPTKTQLFETRELARNYIKVRYGYMKTRPELRKEPHCWFMPRPFKVSVRIEI